MYIPQYNPQMLFNTDDIFPGREITTALTAITVLLIDRRLVKYFHTQTLTVWEGGSESCSANWCIWDKLNPQDVTNHRSVVGGECVSRETINQRPSGIALSDFQVVVLTARVSLQVKDTEQNTRRLLLKFNNEVSSKYHNFLLPLFSFNT